MNAVLKARDLTRHYEISRGLFKPNALVRALNGVSFQLEAGKTLAVVGESGCGKSTLARALTLIEEPSSGSLQIAGQEVAGAGKAQRKQLRRDVQMVFQNPYASLNPRQKIGDQLPEPLLINTSLSRAERRELQQLLIARGHDIGEADGMIGARTREALKLEQAALGLAADGRAGQRVLQALRASPRP